MAQGLGQFAGDFASPDFPGEGIQVWEELSAIDPGDPYVAGPAVSGYGVVDAGTGMTHVATPDTGPHAGHVPHWSELLDWQHSPMPYLLLATIAYLGIIQLQLAARVGVGRRK